MSDTCPRCVGTGTVPKDKNVPDGPRKPCPICGGRGTMPEEQTSLIVEE